MTHISFLTSQTSEWSKRSIICSSGEESREYYLEAPRKYEADISDKNDYLIILALHYLMEQGGEVRVGGAMDEFLKKRLEEYSRIWSLWCPNTYKIIHFQPDSTYKGIPIRAQEWSIAAFSGGVDACYNVHGHIKRMFGDNSQDIHACVMLHGADIPLELHHDFELAFSSAERMLQNKGIKLIPVRTNYRDYQQRWSWCYYSVVTASLMMFSKLYAHGSCGSCLTCNNFSQLPWGQNFVTDHLLHTSYFEVYAAGSSESRTERVAQLCTDPDIVKNLRVCWQLNAHGANCGVCEKCQRTMLNFMAAGYHGELPFPVSFNKQRFISSSAWDEDRKAFYRDILRYNDRHTRALPEDIRQIIIEKLKDAKKCTKYFRSQKFIKLMIQMIPVASWRRRMRRKHIN